MSDRIGLQADKKDITLAAGQQGVMILTVTNAGYVVDAFDITVTGIDATWYTITPARISLFPKAKAVATMTLHPPLAAQALAGDYAFEVTATSRDDGTQSTTLPLRIWVAATGDVAMAIEPPRIISRQGQYRVAVDNASNTNRTMVLRPSDSEEALRFQFGNPQFFPLATAKSKTGPDDQTAQYNVATGGASDGIDLSQPADVPQWTPAGPDSAQGSLTLTIPAANRLEIPLIARRKQREWFGAVIPYTIDVTATPPGVEWEEGEARRASAEFHYPPIFAWASGIPIGLQRLIPILIALLILSLLLFLLVRPNGSGPGSAASQTQTALAASASQTAAALSAQLTAAAQTAEAGGPAAQTAAAQTAAALAAQQTAEAASAAQTAAAQTAIALGLSPADQTATAQAGAGVTGPPRIVRFDWSESGGAVEASWEVTPTNSLTITINKTPVAPSGSMPVDVNEDRSYTLEASNPKGEASRSIGVALLRPPTIKLFTAEPVDVTAGGTVTLRWETTRAERITLDGAPVDGPNGSVTVTPGATTDYILTVDNSFGSTVARVTVNVTGTAP